MLAIKCTKCGKEFKVSGDDFEDRIKNKIANVCPACVNAEDLCKEERKAVKSVKVEKVKKIEKKKAKEINENIN